MNGAGPRRRMGWAVAGLLATIAVGGGAGSALAADYAPVDHPGPALSVPRATLEKAVNCTADVGAGKREPILLVPGTDLTPGPNFSWNYERALSALHFPYCTVELPAAATGDIQVAGEYVVYAIRRLHALSRLKVQIIGYSQGGMVPRWALRFWPDTRALVDDDVGLDASNHGTTDADATCGPSMPCQASNWQQRSQAQSRFMMALNSRQETFPGISYTEVFSHADEVVVPNFDTTGSSSVHGDGGEITNVAVQDICPNDTSDHLAMGSYDPVGYALAIDAVTHPGPASAARISSAVCAQPFQPGVDPATFATDYAGFLNAIAQGMNNAQKLPAEPPLKCYVFAACPAAAPHRPPTATPRHHHARRHHRHRRRHTHRRRDEPDFTG
jgi:triacylglycerol esterase/lipase EstA (alpha/beta hydrolase family)